MKIKLYKHLKTGGVYRIIQDEAFFEEDMSKVVVYQSLENGKMFVRKANVFHDGRFEFVGYEDKPSQNMFQDVLDFHEKFGLDYEGPARALPADLSEFRFKFLDEELAEYKEAQKLAYDETSTSPLYRDEAEYTFQLAHALDGLVDLVYVALGTAVFHGFNFPEAWRRVHAANMKKVRTPTSLSSKRGSVYDVIKPPGWEPPNLDDLTEVNDIKLLHSDRS